jgi:hypothetical protein
VDRPVGTAGATTLEIHVLSNTEQRQFRAIITALSADPQLAAVSRAGTRRIRRQQFWRWLAPAVVARRHARRRAQLFAYAA